MYKLYSVWMMDHHWEKKRQRLRLVDTSFHAPGSKFKATPELTNTVTPPWVGEENFLLKWTILQFSESNAACEMYRKTSKDITRYYKWTITLSSGYSRYYIYIYISIYLYILTYIICNIQLYIYICNVFRSLHVVTSPTCGRLTADSSARHGARGARQSRGRNFAWAFSGKA